METNRRGFSDVLRKLYVWDPMPKCDPRNLSWELFLLEAATEMYSLEMAIATF